MRQYHLFQCNNYILILVTTYNLVVQAVLPISMLEMQGIKLFGLQASLQLVESEPAYAGITWRNQGTFPFGKVQLLNCYHYKLQLAICPYYSARLNS